MSMYEDELAKAHEILRAAGRDPADFAFEMEYMEPDPDGAGMFTVQYVVRILNRGSGKRLRTLGGIGSDWLGHFQAELDGGHFD
jgi:hypothetical protein